MKSRRTRFITLAAAVALASAACGDDATQTETTDPGGSGAAAEEEPSQLEDTPLDVEAESRTCTGNADAMLAFSQSLEAAPYWHLADPLLPSSFEALARLGYNTVVSGTVTAVEKAENVSIEEFVPGVEEATENSLSWGGFLATVATDDGKAIEVPLITIVGSHEVVEAFGVSFEGDEQALVGACAVVVSGSGASSPLELGTPEILAVSDGPDATPIPFSYNLRSVVTEDGTIDTLTAEVAAGL